MLHITAEIYYYGMIAVTAYFLFMATANILDARIRSSLPSIKSGPVVSVLIPARNEEQNIEKCVNSLLDQDYQNYEILVIDDNSEDKTFEIVKKMAEANTRVRAFKGEALPPDWYGKPFALNQLVSQSKGEILLFTDADTFHSPTSISWAVTNMANNKADLISGYAGQILKTFGERVTVPLIYFLTGFLIPMFLNKVVKLGYFSLAVGQYVVVKKEVFLQSGGFAGIKHKTSEDVFMARHIKALGYNTEFLDLSGQVFCRMYRGWKAGIQGIGKNIYDFLGKNPPVLILIALVILFFFCTPFPVLVFSLISSALGLYANPYLFPLVVVHIIFTLIWLVIFIGRRLSWYNAFTWPIMYFNLFFMVIWSFYRTISGRGFIWKDRVVS
ncbi:MAG: glycosyltransferase family 2 protein [Treponema sp.]|jgi:chlorobactene glucosyltransferase|nr:glycosyltransferase family 2 protein [Treponema sp.]